MRKIEGQTISVTNPVLFVLTRMTENSRNPQQSPKNQNTHNPPGKSSRYHGSHRYHANRDQTSPSKEKPTEKPLEPKDLSLDDEETEHERSSAHDRHSRGGTRGKPPKRVIEEWANDIYCEWDDRFNFKRNTMIQGFWNFFFGNHKKWSDGYIILQATAEVPWLHGFLDYTVHCYDGKPSELPFLPISILVFFCWSARSCQRIWPFRTYPHGLIGKKTLLNPFSGAGKRMWFCVWILK